MTDKFLKSLKLNKNAYKIPSKLSDLDIDMEVGGGALIITLNYEGTTIDKTFDEIYDSYVDGKRLILLHGINYYNLFDVKLNTTKSNSYFYFGGINRSFSSTSDSYPIVLYKISNGFVQKTEHSFLTDKYEFDFSGIEVDQTQTDWNQNDGEASDYIKNRTHYVEGVETVELFKETLSITDNMAIPSNPYEIEVGKSYILQIPNLYQSTPIVAVEMEEDGITLGVLLSSEYVMYLYLYDEYVEMLGSKAVFQFNFADTPPASLEVAILGEQESVKTLDPKYLPEMSLGFSDGLLYLFIDGKPVGEGLHVETGLQ